jgi:archaellin
MPIPYFMSVGALIGTSGPVQRRSEAVLAHAVRQSARAIERSPRVFMVEVIGIA